MTHRVVDIRTLDDGTRVFVTKGDANEDRDGGFVRPELVSGRVVVTFPFVGRVISFANTPVGFATLVVVPIGLLIASEVAGIVGAGRNGSSITGRTDKAGPEDGSESDGPGRESGVAEMTPGAHDSAGHLTDPPSGDVGEASAAFDDADETVGAADTPAPSGTGGSSAVELVLTPADLTITSAVLVPFAAYAGYIAYTTRMALSISVAVGAVSGLGLALLLRWQMRGGDDPVRIDFGGEIDDLPRVEVDSASALAAVAAAAGAPVVRAVGPERDVVVTGGVVYESAEAVRNVDGDAAAADAAMEPGDAGQSGSDAPAATDGGAQ